MVAVVAGGVAVLALAGCSFGGASASPRESGVQTPPAQGVPTPGARVSAPPDAPAPRDASAERGGLTRPSASGLDGAGLEVAVAVADPTGSAGPPVGHAPVVSVSTAPVDGGMVGEIDVVVTADPDGLELSAVELVLTVGPSVEVVEVSVGGILGEDTLVALQAIDEGGTGVRLAYARTGRAGVPTVAGEVARVRLSVAEGEPGPRSVSVAVLLTDASFVLRGPLTVEAAIEGG